MNANTLKKALAASDSGLLSALDTAESGQGETEGHSVPESSLQDLYSEIFNNSEVRQGVSTTRKHNIKEF